jgi:hypothetical protein
VSWPGRPDAGTPFSPGNFFLAPASQRHSR